MTGILAAGLAINQKLSQTQQVGFCQSLAAVVRMKNRLNRMINLSIRRRHKTIRNCSAFFVLFFACLPLLLMLLVCGSLGYYFLLFVVFCFVVVFRFLFMASY